MVLDLSHFTIRPPARAAASASRLSDDPGNHHKKKTLRAPKNLHANIKKSPSIPHRLQAKKSPLPKPSPLIRPKAIMPPAPIQKHPEDSKVITHAPKEKKKYRRKIAVKKKAIHVSRPSRDSRASARKRFIRHHLGRIMRISQQTLLRLGIPRVHSRRRHVRATASFRLHPDGSISGLHLSRRSGIRAIDRRTLQVIRRAHRRYPRPTVPLSVRITMRYGL